VRNLSIISWKEGAVKSERERNRRARTKKVTLLFWGGGAKAPIPYRGKRGKGTRVARTKEPSRGAFPLTIRGDNFWGKNKHLQREGDRTNEMEGGKEEDAPKS